MESSGFKSELQGVVSCSLSSRKAASIATTSSQCAAPKSRPSATSARKHEQLAPEDDWRARQDCEREEIWKATKSILVSRTFAKAYRLRELLQWIVGNWLENKYDQLDAHIIATAVFKRDNYFDPGIDPIVRVAIARLRRLLLKYYANEGSDSTVRIALPKGTYIPRVRRQPVTTAVINDLAVLTAGTVMILPFCQSSEPDPGSRNPRDSYDHLIWLFTQEASIYVISRISSVHAGLKFDIGSLRKKIGTRFVVEATVSQASADPHLSVHLTETTMGYDLWSGYYILASLSIVDLSRRIARDLLVAMRKVVAMPREVRKWHVASNGLSFGTAALRCGSVGA